MRMLNPFRAALFAPLLALVLAISTAAQGEAPHVLLISIDGLMPRASASPDANIPTLHG